MRVSTGFSSGLTLNWYLFAARAVVALLLALAVAAAGSLDTGTLAGTLGQYAVTDGVLTLIMWLRERRLKELALEGGLSVFAGASMMFSNHAAGALLVWFAVRGLMVGLTELFYGRKLRQREQPSARWVLLSGGISALLGTAFLVISLFGYDAVELRYCIAGQLALFGGLLLTYALSLRGKARGERHSVPHGHRI